MVVICDGAFDVHSSRSSRKLESPSTLRPTLTPPEAPYNHADAFEAQTLLYVPAFRIPCLLPRPVIHVIS